ncbi:MAG: TerC family protein [Acidimicrobiia bacterium]|nr:TerC family protein [Acidimicrobiia bacterium]
MDIAWWIWAVFVGGIVVLLLIDLLAFQRDAHEVSRREAAISTTVWIGLGLAFTFVIWAWLGGSAASEYLTAYLVEKSLSIDNIFVFAVVFEYFMVPDAYRHRVLFWGIFGALVLRFAFIVAGVALIEQFERTLIVFGALLLFTAYRMITHSGVEIHPEQNPAIRAVRRFIPVSTEYDGARLFTKIDGKRFATPLFVVLVMIESSDVIFAVDSVPAVFGVTTDAFLVFSSNAFAILGLRALYFLLADSLKRFRYLNYGLAAVLAFVGGKMIVDQVFDIHVPIWMSLSFIVLAVGASIAFSLYAAPEELDQEISHPPLAGGLAGIGSRPKKPESPETHSE